MDGIVNIRNWNCLKIYEFSVKLNFSGIKIG